MDEINKVTDRSVEMGYRHANADWKAMALKCLETICLREPVFTMDDVRWLIDASAIKTHDNRAVGGVVRTARTLGWIEATGRTIASKVGHKSLLQVWRSKLYKYQKL